MHVSVHKFTHLKFLVSKILEARLLHVSTGVLTEVSTFILHLK